MKKLIIYWVASLFLMLCMGLPAMQEVLAYLPRTKVAILLFFCAVHFVAFGVLLLNAYVWFELKKTNTSI